MPTLGLPELLIIAFIIVVLFGAGKLPHVMKSLAQGLREPDTDDYLLYLNILPNGLWFQEESDRFGEEEIETAITNAFRALGLLPGEGEG